MYNLLILIENKVDISLIKDALLSEIGFSDGLPDLTAFLGTTELYIIR